MIEQIALVGIGVVAGLGLGYVLFVRPKFMGKDNTPSDYARIFRRACLNNPPPMQDESFGAQCMERRADFAYPYCACTNKGECRAKKQNYRR